MDHACASVPVSVDDHLAALTDRTARAQLLDGAHSVWYEQVKVLLHQALNDLDAAAGTCPEGDHRGAGSGSARAPRCVAECSEGAELPDDENRRPWEHEAPFLVSDRGVEGLGQRDREFLDRVERGITDDPHEFGSDRYFLNVEAPMPDGEHGRDSWGVEILLWVPDAPEDEEGAATGEPVLRCTLSAPPAVGEIVELLNRVGGRQEQIAAWAKTPVGEVLDGTAFVMTERY